MKVIFSLVFFCFLILGVSSFPDGAPEEACGDVTDIVPNHNYSASSDDLPFSVILDDFEDNVYIPDMSYALYLESNSETNYSFRGFMIQARTVADDSPAGYFLMNSSSEYEPQCDDDTAATHTNNSDKESVEVLWMAPPAGTGAIRFRYAFVLNLSTYWANLYTDSINEGCTDINGTCECTPGYQVEMDNITCIDIDECTEDPCDHNCTNTNGSFTCSCNNGYELDENGRSCNTISSGTDESSDDDDGLSTGVVVGIVVGVLVGVIVVTVVIIGIYFWVSPKKGAVKKIKIAPDRGGSDNQKLTKE